MATHGPEERERAVRLVEEVGPTEASRRLGIPKTTLLRWRDARTAAVRTGPDQTGRTERDGEGEAIRGELVAPRARRKAPDQPLAVIVDERLTEAQRAALALLLDARPVSEVAAKVGSTIAEVRMWRQDPVFAGVLSDLVAERRRLVIESIDATVPEAMAYLRKVVAGDEEANKHRIAACFGVLDRGGFPKTERVEHNLPGANPNSDLDRMTPEALAAEEERLLAQVRDVG